MHLKAKNCLNELAASNRPWAISYHNLIEFYGISTHRKLWNQPSPPEIAIDQIKAWQESPSLRILQDTEVSLQWIERLALNARIQGPLIHDVRIAACCISHGVSELWTVDRDFSRFPELKTRNPLT